MSDENLERFLAKAVHCIDKESDSLNISGIKDMVDFDVALQLIMDELNSSRLEQELKVSRTRLKQEIRKILNKIKREEDLKHNFYERFNETKKHFGQRKEHEYKICFPLNLISSKDGKIPKEFSVLNQEFTKISEDEWFEQYVNEAETDEEYQKFFEQSPNDLFGHFTYWKTSLTGREEAFCVERVEELLSLLLGKINYAVHYGKTQILHGSKSIRPWRWSDLRIPFVYLVWKNNDYSDIYYNEDISVRERFALSGPKFEKFQKTYNALPNLETGNTIDEEIVRAFRSFQSGIAAPSMKEAFFNFWRGVETLTLVGEEHGSKEVLERAISIASYRPSIVPPERIELLAEKRNVAVHQGTGVNITKLDRNFLKSHLDSLIHFFLSFKDEFSFKDFDFVLTNGEKNIDELKTYKTQKTREAELLEKMIKWER